MIGPAVGDRVTKLGCKLSYNADQSDCEENKIEPHSCE